jgi:hypothetical protein
MAWCVSRSIRRRVREIVEWSGRRFGQHQAEKLAERKRVSRPPRDRTLGIQAFEIPDQQQAEVAARRQPWPALVRVESLAESFDVPVEVVGVEDLIQRV